MYLFELKSALMHSFNYAYIEGGEGNHDRIIIMKSQEKEKLILVLRVVETHFHCLQL